MSCLRVVSWSIQFLLLLVLICAILVGKIHALVDAPRLPLDAVHRKPLLAVSSSSLRGGHQEESLSLEVEEPPVPPPEGFYLEHNIVPEETWKRLEHWLEHDTTIPWEIGAQNRSVAQFGFRYNYDTSEVEFAGDDDIVPEIPVILRQLLLQAPGTRRILEQIKGAAKATTEFTQCIINVYHDHDIIPWHWDHVDFGPTILVFTFGETRPLQLRKLLQKTSSPLPRSQCHHNEGDYDATKDYQYCTTTPGHSSSYVLSGPCRYQWEHSVPPGAGYRVSFTFRTHVNNQQRHHSDD
ncbi:expressed unknown protein [Seminavis robusta]|uniref:Fe2OG dioxygenase domain-containing protein n=1 Tax=Seminavis robusta TaxID=568900 RepID=A0A9N8ECW4_9STRA|nr:expressed unknown protein [Seminavis robusta]|eukprot:Sro894_g217100.1 n/a (295) ;mRNA; f:7639-8523